MRERRETIEQAYRFALAPTRRQEELLLRFTGATRFFFNWGLGLVKQRLNQRAAGGDASVPWSYKALCSEFARVKDEVAPWRREVVCGSQQAGMEQLAQALRTFSAGRRAGRRVGFPHFRVKGRSKEAVIFQHPRFIDGRHVEFDRRLGPIRVKERISKLTRLLAGDERARILRATVSRRGHSWYVSFTVRRSAKRRVVRRRNAAIGVDVGLAHLATLSTGQHIENARPLQAVLPRLRRLQRELDRQRRAANPDNYLPDGRIRPGPKQWRTSTRMARTRQRVRRLHERVANLRRQQAHRLTTALARDFGVIGIETLAVRNMMSNRRLARQIADVGWGTVLEQPAYKTSWANSTLVAASRFDPSSKTCSACATVKPKLSLAERSFRCHACGYEVDRDLNAAMNLARMAQRHAQAEGNEQCYVAAAEAETRNARRDQVSPAALPGRDSLKREVSGRDTSQLREALAAA